MLDLQTWNQKPRTISVVVDNDSWVLPYAATLVDQINGVGDCATLHRSYETVGEGQIAFFLGCVTKAPSSILKRNTYNLVVHESALPQGRGFAPMTWQILEGKKNIPVCLIEAAEAVDAGQIYAQSTIELRGNELVEEWRDLQGKKTIDMCMNFVQSLVVPKGQEQLGTPTLYKRRTPKDSQIDPDRSIADQFNLLRVCDNERYPAYFVHEGQTYLLKIEKAGQSYVR